MEKHLVAEDSGRESSHYCQRYIDKNNSSVAWNLSLKLTLSFALLPWWNEAHSWSFLTCMNSKQKITLNNFFKLVYFQRLDVWNWSNSQNSTDLLSNKVYTVDTITIPVWCKQSTFRAILLGFSFFIWCHVRRKPSLNSILSYYHPS